MESCLSPEEKQLLHLIDEQVGVLLKRKASELAIIEALKDFIPEVRCLMDTCFEKELALYYFKYRHFAWFARLLGR
ncbi:hypothetical protein Lspi_1941 [Legionella spiritensis]|uniref:Uncharacterized protein n=1 Tax=Legionella spiritensis TaxID=452 RepID=A0A0W0YZ36_LEGSP|nr:hypothetical protein Lspi_1941 [Legionella spiritensis]